MAAKSIYRVRIAKGGEEFEAEGDKAFVLEMLGRFESARPSAASDKHGKPLQRDGARALRNVDTKAISASEFIRQTGFKKHTDIVLAFGYYLEKQGADDFTAADINNCYYEAKMESSNTSHMVILNIRRGFLMEAKGGEGSKRRYRLTRSGEGKEGASRIRNRYRLRLREAVRGSSTSSRCSWLRMTD